MDKKEVFIQGNPNYGKKIIAELEKRGGINAFNHKGDDPNCIYVLDINDQIVTIRLDESISSLVMVQYEEIKCEDLK